MSLTLKSTGTDWMQSDGVIKCAGPAVRLPRFESQLCNFLAVSPWLSNLVCLCLNFFIPTMG